MRSVLAFFLLLSFYAHAATTVALRVVSSPINVSAIPNRISGVAPLAVFFDASATTASGVSNPFHDIQYSWSFGDSGAGSWANGAGGNASKNVAYGAVAAHVYETAGTFTATLTAYDGTNTATWTQAITVTSADAYYSTTNTICVSKSGGYVGCPSGASQQSGTDFCSALGTYLSSGKRVLFEGGQTYACAAQVAITATGPWTVGSYGTGRAIVSTAQASGVIVAIGGAAGNAPSDGRIVDLEFTQNTGTTTASIKGVGQFDNLLLSNLNIHDIGDGPQFLINQVDVSGNTHVWDSLAIVGSAIQTIKGGAGAHGVYIFATRFALLGNLIDDTAAAEHLVRLDYLYKAAISNNTLSNGAANKEQMALRGIQQDPGGSSYAPYAAPAPAPSQYIVVSDNDITTNDASGVIEVKPANDTIVTVLRDLVIERNWLHGTASNGAVQLNANGATVRNNLIDMTGWAVGGTGMVVANAATTGTGAGTNLGIYNNSGYNGSALNAGILYVAGSGTAATVKNNLLYTPSSGAPYICVGTCGGVTASGNSTTGQMVGTNPYPGVPSTPATNWKPTAGSYAIGGGVAVPVWSDFFLTSEPSPRDMGAVNH